MVKNKPGSGINEKCWRMCYMVVSMRKLKNMPDGFIFEKCWKYARWCYLKNVEKYARWWYRSVMLKICQMVVSMSNVGKYSRWLYLWKMLKSMPDGGICEKCWKICQMVVSIRNDRRQLESYSTVFREKSLMFKYTNKLKLISKEISIISGD